MPDCRSFIAADPAPHSEGLAARRQRAEQHSTRKEEQSAMRTSFFGMTRERSEKPRGAWSVKKKQQCCFFSGTPRQTADALPRVGEAAVQIHKVQ